jgi:hypothetical protein
MLGSNLSLAFYITLGYEKFSLNMVEMGISYCPFCGIILKNFYTSDDYVNEIEGKTFVRPFV